MKTLRDGLLKPEIQLYCHILRDGLLKPVIQRHYGGHTNLFSDRCETGLQICVTDVGLPFPTL